MQQQQQQPAFLSGFGQISRALNQTASNVVASSDAAFASSNAAFRAQPALSNAVAELNALRALAAGAPDATAFAADLYAFLRAAPALPQPQV